ncbi:uncharacterized protein LOC127802284 [Diospyros lotus]|uniref:uncharacterized protein LOC127802284 n=1 Tax=Diospyros lotus TaxID=55363 RepID=UPI002250E863|nr:uncharacterized protein LOC127802284 [Diospyros lotus]
MKKDVAELVSRCLVCQQVKAEHQRPAGLIQSLPIPIWKWDDISMDFVTRLPRTSRGHDTIWVIIDRLTKSAYFLPIKKTFPLNRLAQLYIGEIVRLHGVPSSIVSNLIPNLLLTFGTLCRRLWYWYGTLRGTLWTTLSVSIMLGGNRDKAILGPEIVEQTTEKIRTIRARMKAAQDRKKSYADCRRRALEFSIGDHVFLKVMPVRGIQRFGVSGKLGSCYVSPFEILERVGALAYWLALPPQLASVHNVFHVSMLRKYVPDPQHVIDFQPLELREILTYEEFPSCILDRKEKVLRNRVIPYVKVLWQQHDFEEATWELENEMRRLYPHLFEQTGTEPI